MNYSNVFCCCVVIFENYGFEDLGDSGFLIVSFILWLMNFVVFNGNYVVYLYEFESIFDFLLKVVKVFLGKE